MSETGPAQQLFNVRNRIGAAAFCIGIRAGALDTAFFLICNSERLEVGLGLGLALGLGLFWHLRQNSR